jgi:hypothetical protein
MINYTINATNRDSFLLLQEMKEFLRYNKETGLFAWIKKPNDRSPNIKVGVPLTKPNATGYLTITFKNKTYQTHRIAWLFVYGGFPRIIDHINGIKSDNRICNLREATRSQNGMNRAIPKNNTSGYKGVSFMKETGKWRARVIVNYIPTCLGIFDTPELASEAYKKYAKQVFGEFYCD